jgi:4'-phosphopantetheinyl transferase
VKAEGRRLTEGLRLPALGPAPVRCGETVRCGEPAVPLPGPYLVDDLPAPAGFRAAVAVVGDQPYQTFVHRWLPSAALSTVDSLEQMVVEHA